MLVISNNVGLSTSDRWALVSLIVNVIKETHQEILSLESRTVSNKKRPGSSSLSPESNDSPLIDILRNMELYLQMSLTSMTSIVHHSSIDMYQMLQVQNLSPLIPQIIPSNAAGIGYDNIRPHINAAIHLMAAIVHPWFMRSHHDINSSQDFNSKHLSALPLCLMWKGGDAKLWSTAWQTVTTASQLRIRAVNSLSDKFKVSISSKDSDNRSNDRPSSARRASIRSEGILLHHLFALLQSILTSPPFAIISSSPLPSFSLRRNLIIAGEILQILNSMMDKSSEYIDNVSAGDMSDTVSDLASSLLLYEKGNIVNLLLDTLRLPMHLILTSIQTAKDTSIYSRDTVKSSGLNEPIDKKVDNNVTDVNYVMELQVMILLLMKNISRANIFMQNHSDQSSTTSPSLSWLQHLLLSIVRESIFCLGEYSNTDVIIESLVNNADATVTGLSPRSHVITAATCDLLSTIIYHRIIRSDSQLFVYGARGSATSGSKDSRQQLLHAIIKGIQTPSFTSRVERIMKQLSKDDTERSLSPCELLYLAPYGVTLRGMADSIIELSANVVLVHPSIILKSNSIFGQLPSMISTALKNVSQCDHLTQS